MKIYHMNNQIKSQGIESQIVFAASDDSKGINDMKEVFTQVIIWKNKKNVEVLIPKDWSVTTNKCQKIGDINSP